jgi:FkbM family methyltransferase
MKKVLRRLKSKLTGRLIHSPTVSLPYDYFGTDYGGWPILKSTLSADSIILSFGLGTDISFDLAVIRACGCRVIGFDPTPRSIDWLAKQTLPEQFQYHQIGIAATDDEADFFPPSDGAHVSFSSQPSAATASLTPIRAPVRRLSTILDELQIPHVDVVKMDIEGFEYDVIDDILASPVRPRQLLIEFHHTMYDIGRDKTERAFRQLEAAGYKCFYVSDVGLEYGFVLNS